MIAVTLRGLVVRFGDVAALDRIDLEVRAGELLLLLGPSGCGKSTLLRSIAGFVVPDQGTIRFGEEEVTRLAPHQRHTGMVFQSFALWPHLSVGENVAFGLRERRVDKREIAQRVQESLEAVRMGAHTGRRIDQLSGGEQQRVALARALVIRPRCQQRDLDVAPGKPVWVSLRPECLSLTAAVGASLPNAIAGELESTAYLGGIAEHRFGAGGELLRIHELNPPAARPAEASRLAVIAPADVVLVPIDDDR